MVKRVFFSLLSKTKGIQNPLLKEQYFYCGRCLKINSLKETRVENFSYVKDSVIGIKNNLITIYRARCVIGCYSCRVKNLPSIFLETIINPVIVNNSI